MVRLFFSVCLCIAFWVVNCSAIAPEYRSALHKALLDRYYEHPEYKLGGKLDNQTDCSRLIQKAMDDAGIPGTSERTQAWVICAGKGAYRNKPILDWLQGNNEECDILCQHIKDGLERPLGINHILAIVKWNGAVHIIHASSSRKTVVIEPIKPWVEKALIQDGYRRFTVGDK